MDNRVLFDFEISFSNGGGLKGYDFRLDIETNTITDQALANHLIADMRLLMVQRCIISNKKIIQEPHKRKEQAPPTGPLLIDLSHTIEQGLITYKGLPAPIVCDFLSRIQSRSRYESGTEFQIDKIEMVGNTGTYLDSPYHRYENGKDLSELLLTQCMDLEAVVVSVPFSTSLAITEEHLKQQVFKKNSAVLIHTGWDQYWNTASYYTNHPYLTQAAADYLKDCHVNLVGIDSHNIDDTAGNARPVHTTLLGSDILIVEHLCNLQLLPADGFRFSAIPPKFKNVGTFPVRAVATITKKR